jgi:hypothetical protein
MTPAARRLTLATLAVCAVVLGVVEDESVAVAQAMAAEARAEISPPRPLCLSSVKRLALTGEYYWAPREWALAQQADGGAWVIDCHYGDSH